MKTMIWILLVVLVLVVVWNVAQQREIGTLHTKCSILLNEVEKNQKRAKVLINEVEQNDLEIQFLNDMNTAIYKRLPGPDPDLSGPVEHSPGM